MQHWQALIVVQWQTDKLRLHAHEPSQQNAYLERAG